VGVQSTLYYYILEGSKFSSIVDPQIVRSFKEKKIGLTIDKRELNSPLINEHKSFYEDSRDSSVNFRT
jgi:hypothetical protein